MSSHRVEVFAILILTAIWGSAFALIKIALTAFSPGQLTLARFIPTLPIFAWLVWRDRARLRVLSRVDWLQLGIAGTFATTVYNVALNTGETHVGAGMASLVIALNPAVILAGAVMFRGERVSRSFVYGVALSFVGVFVLTLSRERMGFDVKALSGVGAILFCPISWATYTLLISHQVHRVGALAATSAATLIGILIMLPATPFLFDSFPEASLTVWLCVMFLGLFSTVIGFSIWAWLLKRRGAARTGFVVYLNVVWGLLFAWFILDESMSMQTMLGALLILGGVAIARRAGSKPA